MILSLFAELMISPVLETGEEQASKSIKKKAEFNLCGFSSAESIKTLPKFQNLENILTEINQNEILHLSQGNADLIFESFHDQSTDVSQIFEFELSTDFGRDRQFKSGQEHELSVSSTFKEVQNFVDFMCEKIDSLKLVYDFKIFPPLSSTMKRDELTKEGKIELKMDKKEKEKVISALKAILKGNRDTFKSQIKSFFEEFDKTFNKFRSFRAGVQDMLFFYYLIDPYFEIVKHYDLTEYQWKIFESIGSISEEWRKFMQASFVHFKRVFAYFALTYVFMLSDNLVITDAVLFSYRSVAKDVDKLSNYMRFVRHFWREGYHFRQKIKEELVKFAKSIPKIEEESIYFKGRKEQDLQD